MFQEHGAETAPLRDPCLLLRRGRVNPDASDLRTIKYKLNYTWGGLESTPHKTLNHLESRALRSIPAALYSAFPFQHSWVRNMREPASNHIAERIGGGGSLFISCGRQPVGPFSNI